MGFNLRLESQHYSVGPWVLHYILQWRTCTLRNHRFIWREQLKEWRGLELHPHSPALPSTPKQEGENQLQGFPVNLHQAHQTPYLGIAGWGTLITLGACMFRALRRKHAWGSLGALLPFPVRCPVLLLSEDEGPLFQRGGTHPLQEFLSHPGGHWWDSSAGNVQSLRTWSMSRVRLLPHQHLLDVLSSGVRPSQWNVPTGPFQVLHTILQLQ